MTTSSALRALSIAAGLGVAVLGVAALHDGEARLGIPSGGLRSSSQVVQLDSWPELFLAGAVLGLLSILFVLVGAVPRLASRFAPLLAALLFILLAAVPMLSADA